MRKRLILSVMMLSGFFVQFRAENMPPLGLKVPGTMGGQAAPVEKTQDDKDREIRREEVSKLTDQALLAEIVRNMKHRDVRQAALFRLTDQSLLVDFAQNASDNSVRRMAASMIKDPILFAKVTKIDENEGLESLVERASINYDHVYLAIRDKIVGHGTNALPLLAGLAVDESLPWQQRLVARICYERIECLKDIKKLIGTDWLAHPQIDPKWRIPLPGPEPLMGTIIVPELKDAGLWYYCLEVVWKTTGERGRGIGHSGHWEQWCTLAVKDNPEERIWFLRICSEILKDPPPPFPLFQFSPPPPPTLL